MNTKNYCRIGMLLLAVLCLSATHVCAQQCKQIFYDDFSGDLSKWNFAAGGSITGSDGNPAPCLSLSDHDYTNSKMTFSYVGKNLEISADLKTADSGDQDYANMGLSKQNVHVVGPYVVHIWYTGPTHPTPGYVSCDLLYDDNGSEESEDTGLFPLSDFFPGADGSGWWTAKISIRDDGIVDFYMDDGTGEQLVYTSTHQITTLYDCQASIKTGARTCFFDNAIAVSCDNLRAYWSFDDQADPGHDDSGNCHDATAYGATLCEDRFCDPNKAYCFDGEDDYVEIPGSDGFQYDEMTISAWVKLSGDTKESTIVSKHTSTIHSGYFLGAYYNQFEFFVGMSGNPNQSLHLKTPESYDTSWHHVAGVYDKGSMELYVDGTLAANGSVPGMTYNSVNVQIGKIYGVVEQPWHGIIDEVRIYNRALEQDEIRILAEQPPCEFPDDFEDGNIDTGLWNIDGGSRGWNESQPRGVGSWSYSIDEIVDTDGYLNMHVWGPTSGNGYGAEALLQTKKDFNDGRSYLVNFSWDAQIVDIHYNVYYIQVTDGYIPEYGSLHWPRTQQPTGTTDLLFDDDGITPGDGLPSGKSKSTWSIVITTGAIARLYDGPNATGNLLSEESLDIGLPWHLRFMVIDGTSAGFPAGDISMNIYDFSAACIPRLLNPNGGEELEAGSTTTISWFCGTDAGIDFVQLEYSTSDCRNDWQTIDVEEASAGSYEWTVPAAYSADCLVRISALGYMQTMGPMKEDGSQPDVGDIWDISDEEFMIFGCANPSEMDFNEDCYVDLLDFTAFAAEWLKCGYLPEEKCGN